VKQVIQASLEDGVKEACALLHDWLVILTAQYNEYNKLAQFGQPTAIEWMPASPCALHYRPFPFRCLHFCEAPFYRAMRRGFIQTTAYIFNVFSGESMHGE
jgi:hypothetical protein